MEYEVRMSERVMRYVSHACDVYSRLVCGQDFEYQELFESAWEKRCKSAVGGHGMDDTWDGGWHAMRDEAESLCKHIKKRFWGCDYNAHYGVGYDDMADILFDVHCVLRHRLWLSRDERERSTVTVDAFPPVHAFGSEPLVEVSVIDDFVDRPFVDYMRGIDPLHSRLINALRGAGIDTLRDVTRYTRSSLKRLNGLGDKGIKKLDDILREHNLWYGGECYVQR